jgi:hypothetical protein
MGRYAKCGYSLNASTFFEPILDDICRNKKWGTCVADMIANHEKAQRAENARRGILKVEMNKIYEAYENNVDEEELARCYDDLLMLCFSGADYIHADGSRAERGQQTADLDRPTCPGAICYDEGSKKFISDYQQWGKFVTMANDLHGKFSAARESEEQKMKELLATCENEIKGARTLEYLKVAMAEIGIKAVEIAQSASGEDVTEEQRKKIAQAALSSKVIATAVEAQRRSILHRKMEEIYIKYENIKDGEEENLIFLYATFISDFFSGERRIEYDKNVNVLSRQGTAVKNPTCGYLIRYDETFRRFVCDDPQWSKYADMANDLMEKVSTSWRNNQLVKKVEQHIADAEIAAHDGKKDEFFDHCYEIDRAFSGMTSNTMRRYDKCGYRMDNNTCFMPYLNDLCSRRGWGANIERIIWEQKREEHNRIPVLLGEMNYIHETYTNICKNKEIDPIQCYKDFLMLCFSGRKYILADGRITVRNQEDIDLNRPTCPGAIRYDEASGQFVECNRKWKQHAEMANDLRKRVIDKHGKAEIGTEEKDTAS